MDMHQDVFNRFDAIKLKDYEYSKLFSRKYCGNGVPDWAAHPKKENFPYPLEVVFTSLSQFSILIYTISFSFRVFFFAKTITKIILFSPFQNTTDTTSLSISFIHRLNMRWMKTTIRAGNTY